MMHRRFFLFLTLLGTWLATSSCKPSVESLQRTKRFDSLLNQAQYRIDHEYRDDTLAQVLDSIGSSLDELTKVQEAQYYYLQAKHYINWVNLAGGFYYFKKAQLLIEKNEEAFKPRFRRNVYMTSIHDIDMFKNDLPQDVLDELVFLKEKTKPLFLKQPTHMELEDYIHFSEYHRLINHRIDSALYYSELGIQEEFKKKRAPSIQFINMLSFHSHLKKDLLMKDMNLHQQLDPTHDAKKALALAKLYQKPRAMAVCLITIARNYRTLYSTFPEYEDSVRKYFKQFEEFCEALPSDSKDAYNFVIQYKFYNQSMGIANYDYGKYHKLSEADFKIKYQLLKAKREAMRIKIRNGAQKQNRFLFKQMAGLEKNQKEKLHNAKLRTVLIIITSLGIIASLILFALRKKAVYKLKQETQEAILQQKQAQLDGQEQERVKIARELHDQVASTLAALKYRIEALLPTSDSERSASLHKTSRQLSYLYQKVRNLSHIMDMPEISRHTFIEVLEVLIEEYTITEAFETVTNFPSNRALHELNDALRKHLFLLLQELLLNTRKYANASIVCVTIEIKDKELFLIYTDDGIGIPDTAIQKGLHSIKNRLAIIKGQLKVENTQGTEIYVSIPLESIK